MAESGQTRTARRKQKKSKNKPLWKKITLYALIFILAIGIGVLGLFTYYIATAPEIDASKLSDPLSSKVHERNGEVFADIAGDQKRTKIEYDDLPQVLIDAVTATEDARFFEHSGIDLRRIGGAVVGNLRNGFGSEGASTITQQVVEKSFLSPEKKIKLKVQEQWLAIKLEQDYSKEEILEMYLNKIFYGSNAYGVAQAANTYFGKTDLNDLTLPEAAILAGLPQRPTAYNPYENPDLTKGRMETVLKLMVRHEKISQEDADEALQVDIPSLLQDDRPDSTPYEAFLQQVRKEVEQKVDGADIYTDGLEIHTTLDTSIQEYVEFLLTDSEENPIPYPDDEMKAGMVVLDTNNGAILAVGGSRNNEGIDGFNYAIDRGQQPGSTFKPIISYGPAIEYNKISTYHQINDDKPYEITGTDQVSRNWNNQYSGWMTARHALKRSLNVPALKTLDEVGYGNAKEFSERLGVKFADDQINVTDAIGGAKTNVTPLQLAGAYRAFGNEGIYNEPYAVTKVVFPDGRTIELSPEPEVVMAESTAYMVTDMLKSSVAESDGTGYARANVSGLPMAGKTGTTNLKGQQGSPDSWFAGYTTNFTISVWTGGYTDEEGNRTVMPDTKISQDLFRYTMTEISKDIETSDFVKPNSVVEVAVEKGSNPAALPSDHTPQSEIITELFVKGTEPKETSEKFDQLDPVSDLTAKYNPDSDSILVEWNYDEEADVSFEVSASVDGGQMQSLSIIDENSIEISELDDGAEYEIQVVVISNEDESNVSEPRSTTLTIEREEEEEESNEGNISSIEGLEGYYDEAQGIIDVSWNYNGPPVEYEVFVEPNNQSLTVQNTGVEISGVEPGTTYTITVTPIGTNGANEGASGTPSSVTIEVPSTEDEPTNGDGEDNGGNGNEDDNEHNDEE